ncbi:hypothetical protein CMEL01_00957 [Colletotrichum melonis]|uniref:Uncharacterized protein n=1 Tax=Colletotrichum melonis TaxID=1209925 RepID=A0AAI9V4H2_9PEZI|nr:hypothetical protein CMEL01_00957 [Colletotrichum melonis]
MLSSKARTLLLPLDWTGTTQPPNLRQIRVGLFSLSQPKQPRHRVAAAPLDIATATHAQSTQHNGDKGSTRPLAGSTVYRRLSPLPAALWLVLVRPAMWFCWPHLVACIYPTRLDGITQWSPNRHLIAKGGHDSQNTLHAVATERHGQNNCAPALASASPDRLNIHLHMPEVWCVRAQGIRPPPHHPHLSSPRSDTNPVRDGIPEPLSPSTVHPITDPSLVKRSTSLTSFTPNPGSQLADRWIICASGPPICINRAAAAQPPKSDLKERQGAILQPRSFTASLPTLKSTSTRPRGVALVTSNNQHAKLPRQPFLLLQKKSTQTTTQHRSHLRPLQKQDDSRMMVPDDGQATGSAPALAQHSTA